jgi:hypothetical protein
MQFSILIYEPPADFALRNDEAKQAAYWGAWSAYFAAVNEAGVFVSGAGLMPPHTATTVRLKGEKRLVQDGPYADTKEQLGGVFVVEVPNLDAALDWAARCPAAPTGVIEVRPVLPKQA